MAETRLSPILLAALLLALGGQARADENTTHFVPTAPAETAPPPLSGITPVLEAGLIQLTRGFVFNQVYLNATEDCFAAASPPTLPRVGWCWSNTSASTAAPNFRRWDGSRWAAEAVLNVLNHGWGWPGSPPFPHVAPNPSLIASATATDSNDLWSKDFAGENGAPSVLHWPSLDSEAGACGNQVLASGDGCWRAAVALDRLEWGAKGDGTTEDTAAIRAAMADALANGRPGITLTPGIHKLSKTATGSDGSAVALLISGASNGFTLDCYGSTLSFNGSTPSNYAHVIRIENSSKVTLKNCEVDWSALPYTQATLSAINVGSADFQIDPVYPIAWTSVQQIEEFKPSTVGGIPAVWVKMVFDWTGGDRHVTNVGGGLYRVDFSADPAGLAKLATGHSYLLTSRFYGADGINAYNVDDLVLDNVRCYATGGKCIATWGGTNVTVKNGSGPRLLPGSTRWRSANADGVQIAFARGAVMIDGLYDEANGDDAINVLGLIYTVRTVTNSAHYVLNGVQAPGYTPQAGDVLQFMDTTGAVKGTATVISATVSGSTITIVSSAAPASFDTTWVVSDVSGVPSELIVKSGQFRYIRGRGILSNAQKNLFEGNRFDHLTDAPVFLFSDMALAAQGPVPSTITITGNVSENNNGNGNPADFSIFARSLDDTEDAPAGTISGLIIIGNICRNTTNMCIFVDGVSNVSIAKNTFGTWASSVDTSSWHGLAPNAVGAYNVSDFGLGQNNYLSSGEKFTALGSTSFMVLFDEPPDPNPPARLKPRTRYSPSRPWRHSWR